MAQKNRSALEDLLESPDPKKKIGDVTFEDGMKLLEELVISVETGTLPLDRAIKSYEHAAVLINHLRDLLSGAEAKLKVLQKNAAGEFEAKSKQV